MVRSSPRTLEFPYAVPIWRSLPSPTGLYLAETLIRTILRRWPGRALNAAWLALVALALCGTYGYAADFARDASAVDRAERLLGDEALTGLDRRFTAQAPSNEHASGADADDVSLPERDGQSSLVVESIVVDTAAVLVFARRLLSSAQPRAPPRSIER